jgi:rhodanese-related sulfurtransferase
MFGKKTDEQKRERIAKAYEGSKVHFREVTDITAEELNVRLGDADLVVVDVREPQEQDVSMIPGAISASDFEANLGEYRGKTVVAYCTVGHRSGLFAQELMRSGWPSVYNLAGAILSWTHAGGDLEDAQGPTKRVHVYARQSSLEAEGYEPVW